MEDASLPYILLSTPSSLVAESERPQKLITAASMATAGGRENVNIATIQPDASAGFDLASTTTAGSMMKESENNISLTTVPIMFATSSGGQVTQILDMGALAGTGGQVVTVQQAMDSASAFSVPQSSELPGVFQASSGCSVEMLNTLTNSKSDMALLQPVQRGTLVTKTSTALSSIITESISDVHGSRETLSDADLSQTVGAASSSSSSVVEIQGVGGSSVSDFPVVISASDLINESPKNKPQDLFISSKPSEHSHAYSESISGFCTRTNTDELKSNVGTVVLSGTGDSLESEKSDEAPAIFPEGAVLVETPQGLMLSVGDELRAVTFTDGPDSHGNQLLSISNNCIPMALLSQCQQGGLPEEQDVVYEGGGEGEGPIICTSELPMVTQQVLTVSTPDEEEPKKKNRGWPKGKKRKTTPEVHGPRAPMTGYVLFAINRRQEIKQGHPELPFTEITKVLGQEWSNMPLDKKQKYLDEAENDKQRYIDELKQFQKSDMYQTLVKKRRMKAENDSADDGDGMEEDSDELHCKLCKLYFSSLHNKKEHMLGRQHLAAITDQLKKELKKLKKDQVADLHAENLAVGEIGSLGNDSRPSDSGDNVPSDNCTCNANRPVDVNSFILDFVQKNSEREQEIFALRRALRKDVQENWSICKQIQELKDYEHKLRQDLRNLSAHAGILTGGINTLKMVPALFGVVNF